MSASKGFLSIKHSENESSIAVVAIIPACFGYRIQSPEESARIPTVSYWYLDRVAGKTYLVSNLVKQHQQNFKPSFQQFMYFYHHFQPVNQELQQLLRPKPFHLCQGADRSFLDTASASIKHTLVIFDNVNRDVAGSKEFLNLAISGRYQKLNPLVLKHNLHQQSSNS